MGRKILKDYENIVIHRMSPAVWSILQPHKNPEDWQEVMQPDSINSFLFQLLGQLENQGVTNVERICIHPADEEYLEWAKKHGIEWNNDSLFQYQPSEADCRRILKKNGFDRNWDLFFIAGIALFDKSVKEVELSEKTNEMIRNYLVNIFGKGHVWYPGYLLRMYDERLMDENGMNFDQIKRVGIASMEENKTIIFDKYKKMYPKSSFKGGIGLFVLLPFLVHGDTDEYMIDIEKFMDISNVRNHPTEHTCDFIGTKIQDMVEKDIKADRLMLCPFIQAEFMLDDFSNEVMRAMRQEE